MASQEPFQNRVPTCCNRLVIFGATGDVTSRLFLPSLAELVKSDHLPKPFSILAIGRQDWSTPHFHQHVKNRFKDLGVDVSPDTCETLLSMITYYQVPDVTDYQKIKEGICTSEGPLVIYLALPPSTFKTILQSFEHIDLPSESRIIFEKPFGTDLPSARELNALVHQVFREEQVFRLDHFLGKQTVKNILGLRFANRFFEPIWNQQHIERVEITWDEMLSIEGRGAYYDANGALKDMIQNHLLQLLCLVGMEPLSSYNEREFRDRKEDLLRSVRHLTPEEVREQSWRARYETGSIEGRPVRAYVEEEDVDPARETETLAEITLWIDNWRWAGVPFILRSGKALGQEKKEIAVFFRQVPHLAFGDSNRLDQNLFRLQLSPDRVGMRVNLNRSEDPNELLPFEMKAELAPQDIPPYGQLFLEVVNGNPTFFIRGDEAEELWRIVEPILETWRAKKVPLLSYPAGSSGPQLRS